MSRKNIENRLKYLQNRYNSFAMFTKVDKVEEKKNRKSGHQNGNQKSGHQKNGNQNN